MSRIWTPDRRLLAPNNGQWTNSGGALSTQAKTLAVGYRAGGASVTPSAASLVMTGNVPSVSNGGSGTTFFSDTMSGAQTRASGRTQAQIVSDALAAGWSEADYSSNGLLQKAWPPAPGTQIVIGLNYTGKDYIDHFRFSFADELGTIGPADIFLDWEEWRSATYTYAQAKDWELFWFDGTNPGRDPSNHGYQTYGSIGRPGSSYGACQHIGMWWQDGGNGVGVNQSSPYSPDELSTTSWVMQNAVPYRIKIRLKHNTPGNSDGIFTFKAINLDTSTQEATISRTGIRMTNTANQYTAREFQLGFTSTSPSSPWPTVSERLFRNIYITDYERP